MVLVILQTEEDQKKNSFVLFLSILSSLKASSAEESGFGLTSTGRWTHRRTQILSSVRDFPVIKFMLIEILYEHL